MAWLKKRGRIFYVVFPVAGRKYPKMISTETAERRAAQAFLEEWERVHVAGDDVAAARAVFTVESWGGEWIEARKARGILDAVNESAHLRLHLYPRLGARPLRDVTKAELLDWVQALPAKGLAPATVAKIAATCRALFAEAAKRDLVTVSPCVWTRGDLPRKVTVSRTREGGLTVDQVELLIVDPRVPEDRRALYALELLTGMRTGEAAARRWRDWDPVFQGELGRLVVGTSYNTRHALERQTTKTDVEKWVPVHPVLAELLRRWKASGWPRMFGRAPAPGDLIVPAAKGGPRNNGTSHRLWWTDLDALGLPRQRHYQTRATFRSLALAGGAVEKDLDRITHPSPKTASDVYDRPALLWPRLCATVRCVAVAPRAASAEPARLAVVAGGNGYSATGTPPDPGDGGPPKGPGGARGSVESGSTAEHGNRTRLQRLSAPHTGFEDRARHQPRTLCRRPVYVPPAGRSRSRSSASARRPRRLRRPIAARRARRARSPHGEIRTGAARSCGITARGDRKYCMGE